MYVCVNARTKLYCTSTCCLMTSEGHNHSEPLRSPRTAASTKTSSCCSSPGGCTFVAIAGNSAERKQLLNVSYSPNVSIPYGIWPTNDPTTPLNSTDSDNGGKFAAAEGGTFERTNSNIMHLLSNSDYNKQSIDNNNL